MITAEVGNAVTAPFEVFLIKNRSADPRKRDLSADMSIPARHLSMFYRALLQMKTDGGKEEDEEEKRNMDAVLESERLWANHGIGPGGKVWKDRAEGGG